MTEGLITTLLHHDRRNSTHGEIHAPVHTSVQYAFKTADQLVQAFEVSGNRTAIYARSGTPTVFALEDKVTLMEGGVGTVCFASGMAAISATFLSLLNAGDHLVASKYLFGNTASLLRSLARLGIDVELVDPASAGSVEAALRPATRMVFVESVSNPTTVVADLRGIGALCQLRKIPLVVDNTVLSPLLFQAKSVRAALVLNSLTKTLAGHGAGLGGSVTDLGEFDWTGFDNIAKPYRIADRSHWALVQIRKRGLRDMGGALSSEHAHSIALGLETADLRVRYTCASALRIATHLASHPAVSRVNYPFLKTHPQHEFAQSLFAGGAWLLSFSLQSGVQSFQFIDALKIPAKSTGLGCGRSLVIPVARTLFGDMSPEERELVGIDEGLIRYSVGLESTDDLVNDLDCALSEVGES